MNFNHVLYPTELSRQKLADRAGNDPATSCSTGKCSTTELTILNHSKNGLGKRTRTSRLMLPKHALYQMSYTEKNGGGDRLRTCDSLLANQVLCQLSYTPETNECWWIERKRPTSTALWS